MDKLVYVGFEDETQAFEGARVLRELHHKGLITVSSDAVVVKDRNGQVTIHDSGHRPLGTLGGMLTGSLIGLIGGPIGMAIGAGTGTVVGAAYDLARAGIDRDFVDQVGEHLVPGRSAVVAEIDEDWVTPLDQRMEAVGGAVFRRTRMQVEDAHFERDIEAQQAELASLEAERLAQLEGGRDLELTAHAARLQEKVDAVRRRVKERQDALAARIRSVEDEGDEKVAALRAQAADADLETKARLEKRMAEVRSIYRHRAVQLSEALERRKREHETVA